MERHKIHPKINMFTKDVTNYSITLIQFQSFSDIL